MFESSTFITTAVSYRFSTALFFGHCCCCFGGNVRLFAAVKDGSECEVYSRVGKISPFGHFHLLEATRDDKIE